MASDFSAIHHVTDITLLPARVFWALAWRLPAYPGVMQQRVAAYTTTALDHDGSSPAVATPPPAGGAGVTVVPATREALTSEPAFQGMFSFGTGGGG